MTQTPDAASPTTPPPAPTPPPRRRRWWPWVLAILLVAGLGTYLFWPRSPTVSALLIVPARVELAGIRLGGIGPATGHELTDREIARFRRNQIALARSRAVLAKALATPQVAKLAIVRDKDPEEQ